MTGQDWHGLYGESWSGVIVPDAFTHPAKFSRALIPHIYQHMIDEGWLRAGDTVVDPFGGVALGGLDAMRHGLHWVGCELEQRFVDLGNQNIALWNARYKGKLRCWGDARLVQGDSRELAKVLREAGACVSSPPYAEALSNPDNKLEFSGAGGPIHPRNYGSSPGQLGAMKANGFDAAVSSPPYAESDQDYKGGWKRFHNNHEPLFTNDIQREAYYGSTPGQLGAMKATGFDASVSSPPFENQLHQSENGFLTPHQRMENGRNENAASVQARNYGDTIGNIGNSTGDDFWSAARTIVEQVYSVLLPGAHSVWVVKAFVKDKKRVDFPGQWRQLCEAVGFVTVHEHRAWLVEDKGSQYDFTGELITKQVQRKSFFRRLAEKNGSPSIDWETIICMIKPEVKHAKT